METAEQLRAARAMAGISQEELAEAAGISKATIKRLESLKGRLSANTTTLDALRSALEARGVVFIPANGGAPGVRSKR
jgi:transcriptional regulator with XRE-family HTH domain